MLYFQAAFQSFGYPPPQAGQSLSCQKCGLFFSNYQLFVQHSNMCPANTFQYPLVQPTNQTKVKRTREKCHSKCDCKNGHKVHQKSNNRKRKQTEKENIDPETLAKYRALEWEQRTGYWCQKCKIRFNSSEQLVDHMAKNVHKPVAESKVTI